MSAGIGRCHAEAQVIAPRLLHVDGVFDPLAGLHVREPVSAAGIGGDLDIHSVGGAIHAAQVRRRGVVISHALAAEVEIFALDRRGSGRRDGKRRAMKRRLRHRQRHAHRVLPDVADARREAVALHEMPAHHAEMICAGRQVHRQRFAERAGVGGRDQRAGGAAQLQPRIQVGEFRRHIDAHGDASATGCEGEPILIGGFFDHAGAAQVRARSTERRAGHGRIRIIIRAISKPVHQRGYHRHVILNRSGGNRAGPFPPGVARCVTIAHDRCAQRVAVRIFVELGPAAVVNALVLQSEPMPRLVRRGGADEVAVGVEEDKADVGIGVGERSDVAHAARSAVPRAVAADDDRLRHAVIAIARIDRRHINIERRIILGHRRPGVADGVQLGVAEGGGISILIQSRRGAGMIAAPVACVVAVEIEKDVGRRAGMRIERRLAGERMLQALRGQRRGLWRREIITYLAVAVEQAPCFQPFHLAVRERGQSYAFSSSTGSLGHDNSCRAYRPHSHSDTSGTGHNSQLARESHAPSFPNSQIVAHRRWRSLF